MKGLRSLHSWMFDYGSPVTIGVFRMVFGALALINLWAECRVAAPATRAIAEFS